MLTNYRTIILDRDGVINQVRGDYVKSPDEIRYIRGSISAINFLISRNFNVVVASNQAVVGKKIISHEQLNKITDCINSKLIKKIDFYYCTHSADENCQCRKPKPGLLRMIKDKLSGPNDFIGDNKTDWQAAREANIDFMLVQTGYGNLYQHELNNSCTVIPDLHYLSEIRMA